VSNTLIRSASEGFIVSYDAAYNVVYPVYNRNIQIWRPILRVHFVHISTTKKFLSASNSASDKNLENLSCCKNFGALDLLKGLLERGLKKILGRRGGLEL